MLKWFSNEDGGTGPGPGQAPGSPQGAGGGEAVLGEVLDRLAQTEQLVAHLKELIREKDAALCTKDEQLKTEKEAFEAKLSKMRLQNKAKVTSLTTKLEEMKKQQTPPTQAGQDTTPTPSKKGGSEGGEQASRGKILLLRKKVEELEHLLSQREEELAVKTLELKAQWQRGEEMDAMLAEKDYKLAEKEVYIVHLQTAMSPSATPAPEQKLSEDSGRLQELQMLVQNLTKKVEEGEEHYSLLLEQKESFRELLVTEKAQYEQKENMYKQNIQMFQNIILQKDNSLMEIKQMHEQELFKLAAKSDASADLEQLLKALKQKLHEKEEVLLGKGQVIDVLQGEVDGRDQQIKDLVDRVQRLQVERESLHSKLEAEKHVMRAQIRDQMEKYQAELQHVTDKHQAELAEKEKALRGQLEEHRSVPTIALPSQPATQEVGGGGDTSLDSVVAQRIAELEAQIILKTEEASKSEAKFLKMKAWSKSHIRQLEDELRKNQSGSTSPGLSPLSSRIMDLEEEREEILWKLEHYKEVEAKNDLLEARLLVYEEQQRTMQADLEQFTRRAASQASESGSADDTQSQLEWQEMLSEAVTARDRAKEEKATMALRISHMEEEREVLASRQQELEEEVAQARGLRPHGGKKLGGPAPCTLQEDFEFDRQQSAQDHRSTSESTTPMEGENMGEGLRSVVQELELERNQLQEQIMGLEDRCQDLEDRLQLQTRIECLQNESERLQSQLSALRSQQSRDAEKHQLLVTSLNKQLKGLSDNQECLETSLIEKENMLAKTSEKLELINSLQDSLKDKETQHKDVSDKLLQTGQHLTEVLKKCSTFEKQSLELKTTVADLTQKLNVLKEKTQKQEATIETLQTDLDQTNDELDKLNATHLEERAQLIHDLQSCEREIDNLKDILLEKDKEICVISGNMVEYTEQISLLKQEIKNKEEDLVRIEGALTKAECGAQISKHSQDSDKQSLHTTMAELMEQLKYTENELNKVKEESESKLVEVKDLTKQVKVDTHTIQDLRVEIQRQNVFHHNHLSECEALISSLKDQVTLTSQKLQESESLNSQLKENNSSNEKLKVQLQDKVQIYENDLKSFKEEQNKLLAEVEKHKQDQQALSKQLEEQVESKEQVKRTMQEKLETIISLEEKVKITKEQAEGDRQKFSNELQTRNNEIEQLGRELQGKSQNISKLKSLLKSMKTENQHLQTDLKRVTAELESQKQHVDDLRDKLGASVEEKKSLITQINGLKMQNETLQVEVVERTKSLSELSNEKVSLLSKICAFQTQQSEDVTIIKELQKEKDGLSIRVHELNMVLEVNKQSISETLLEKTNECTNLTKMLRASEETVALLREQVGEREKTVTDLKSHMETQQGQQIQLQETLSLLQEQGNALKSGLLEKDTLLKQEQEECYFLKSEVTQHKSILSELKIVAETSQEECSKLSQLVKEREETLTCLTQECQMNKDELNKRKESVMTLSSQLGVINESASKLESENNKLKKTLEDHVAENNKLRQEMEQGQVESLGLHSHIKALSEQHHQLQTAYVIREKELAQQMQVALDLDRKVTVSLQQISDLTSQLDSLTEENNKLQQELAQKTKSVFELTTEKSVIQKQVTGLEMQHSENRTYIDVLLKEMHGLRQAADESSKALELNKQSLLEKANEYSHLTRLFRETEEANACLHEQIDNMNLQIHQLSNDLADKDMTLVDQCTQIERKQIQLVQLQETVHLHQEQDTSLKSGLMEKDTMLQQKTEECNSLRSEIVLQKERISSLQGEAESLRGECSELSRCLEEKEETIRHTKQEYQNFKDKQNTTNESVMLLSSKLGFMKENTAKLEIEVTELRASLENHAAEKDKLRQEMDQKQIEVVDLMGNIQALNEQKVRSETEFQKSVTEASRALEEISVLRTEISNRDTQVCYLTEQMKAACADKESVALMLQQKDEQLQTKLGKVEGQMSQKMEVITELQTQAQSLQESLQDRDMSLHATEKELAVLREQLTSNSKSFKTQLHSNAEIITQLQGELTNLVEKNGKLTERLTEQEIQLRGQVDNLTSESSLLKETLKEKEQIILENKNISSTVSKSLNSKLQAKEFKLKSLKEQLSDLQELISKLNITLHTQTAELTNVKKTLEEREAAILEQSKALKDMHRRADEAAFFKAQFMESTNLVSQLQSQTQELSAMSTSFSKSAEEKQSALINLQEKYAAHLEELEEARKELSQRSEDISSLSEALSGRNIVLQAAEVNTETLKNESSLLRQDLQQLKTIHFDLSKQHENALANHQRSTSSLTVEIERLKSQHLHVAAQVNALTENLEQREMDLHAINSQYTAQVKHTEHLGSEIQRLEEKNKDLNEQLLLSKQEHQHLDATLQQKAKLQKKVQKLITERDEVSRSHSHKIQMIQEQMQLQTQQQSSSMNEVLEKMAAEKENLQIESQIETAKFENGELVKENDNLKIQLNKLSKEKDVMKKKLQAALVIRKDLLKKIEAHSKQNEINVQNGIELLALQNELQKLSAQTQISTEEHKVHIHILQQQLLQKEEELHELANEQSKREDLVEQLKSNMQTLQTKLNEQEECLTSSLHTVNEKSAIIEQLYCSMSEEKEAFEHDRCDMRIKFNQLQDEMKKQEDIFKQELSRSVSATVDLENNLAKEKQENALFQKKTQAALLARKETMKKSQENENKFNQELSELKNDFKCLQQQHCHQTNELNAIQLSYDQKAKELKDIRETSLSNLDEFRALRQLIEEKDNTIQWLKTALAERESQYQYFSPYQMESHQFNLENISETLVTEKEEQQSQQQIHLHEDAMEKLRTEDLHQKYVEDVSKTKDQDSQMTSKKLQAALISRREILKENCVLKEQIKTLSAKNKDTEASYSALKIYVTNLKQQNENLESSVSSLSNNKKKLVAEVEGILNDNHNLSAACESLKLRIESITQQKQAFSFQLESLKDSQIEELSELKSKHIELKQQYDSLFQAHENASREVDKMRQLLEGARRETQEALCKAYTLESERESSEKQIREMEEENEKIKEKMQEFARTKQQTIEELEEENPNIQKELPLFDDKQNYTVEELITRNHQLEAEIHSLKESSEELSESLTEIRHENCRLEEELKEASCSLEKWRIESRASENSMQLKLDEALNLNNSLTTHFETHKTELAAQLEINELILKERQNISDRLKQMQNEHKEELDKKDLAKAELQEIINRHSQEIISLNEKVRILEDDMSILQEELENVKEISDRVKNENEYLGTMVIKNCKVIEELTVSASGLQAQNTQLSSQLTASKEEKAQVCQEKEKLEIKLVKEFEEKLKVVQRGKEGSKNLKEELQELLKDKHHEINQLQHDCIQYQELILDLERSVSTTHSANEVLKRELKELTHWMFNEVEIRKHLEKELKNHVSEARIEMPSICSEKNKLLVEVSEKCNKFEYQVLERTQALDSDSIGQQKSVNMKRQLVLQKQVGKVQSSKDMESKVVVELGQQLDSQDLQMNTHKTETETTLANIASLSSSTQGTVEGDLNATKGFKHEIRVLLHQMDDLNSDNAMLRAQLIRYREDLNQVLSIKDNQLKEQLRKQQDTIRTLENQKASAEKQYSESLLELQRERDANNVLKAEKAKLQTQVTHTDADILALKKERAQSNERKVIADLQQAVATKAADCNSLQQQLFAQKVAADELKNNMQQLENETAKNLTEAEDKYNSELEVFEREVELIRNGKETADQRLAELEQDILQNDHLLSEAKGQTKGIKCQNESLSSAMVALQNDRDQLIEDFKIMQNRYDDELKETRAAMHKVERCLGDAASELATLSKEKHILVQKLSALKSKDSHSQLATLVDKLSKALSEKEGELKRFSLENDTYSRQVSAFSRSMASIQDDRDRLMHELMLARRERECKQGASLGAVNLKEESNSLKSSIDSVRTERDGLEMRKNVDELQRSLQLEQSYRLKAEKEVIRYQAQLAKFRSEQSSKALKEQQQAEERRDGHPIKDSMALVGSAVSDGTEVKLEMERVQLQRNLQHCLYEIQQRDLYCQQLNAKLQQEVEEKGGVMAQLRVVSQTLRDTQLSLGQLQDRSYWLENQRQASSNQGQALQGAMSMEEAPGAPQERNSAVAVNDMDTMEAVELRANLIEAQQCVAQLNYSLAEERARREAAEDALGSMEGRAKSVESSPSRDFNIQLETEEEWEALILNSNEPLITRKVKGGMLACKRWLRGRSLYCSKLLTTRARSRYFFLAYLLTLHMAVLMCLTGAF